MAQDSRQAAHIRWLGAAQQLGIGSGGATELVARARRARLLDETPAPAQGRGRPTTVLGPHTDGPLVLAAELRATDWRLALAGIDGVPHVVAQAGYAGDELDPALAQLANAIGAINRQKAQRLRAIAVS